MSRWTGSLSGTGTVSFQVRELTIALNVPSTMDDNSDPKIRINLPKYLDQECSDLVGLVGNIMEFFKFSQ